LPDVGFGTPYNFNFQSSYNTAGSTVTNDSITVGPTTNLCSTGSRPIIFTHIYGAASGVAGNSNIFMQWTGGGINATTSRFKRAPDIAPQDTGWVPLDGGYSLYRGDGTSFTFSYKLDSGSSFYYGRTSSGTVTLNPPPSSKSGGLWGKYRYYGVPAAVTNLSVSIVGDGFALLNWTAPDDGGNSIVSYDIVYALDSNFTSPKTINVGTETSRSISGLDSGSTYYFKIFAKNALFTSNGVMGAASNVASISVPIYTAQIFDTPTSFAENPGKFWSLTGHLVGFDSSGKMVEPKIARQTYVYIDPISGLSNNTNVNARINAPSCEKFYLNSSNNKIYADGYTDENLILGSIGTYFNAAGNGSVNRIAFKTILPTSASSGLVNLKLGWIARPGNDLYNQIFNVTVENLTGAPYFKVASSIGNGTGAYNATSTTQTSLGGVDFTQELAVFIFYSLNNTANGKVVVKICNTTNYSVVATLTHNYTYSTGKVPLWNEYINADGYVRSLYLRNGGSIGFYDAPNLAIAEYENAPSYSSTVTSINFPPVHSVTTNMWYYLQDACSATRQEIALVDDVVTIRNVGVRSIDTDSFVEPLNVSIASTFGGKQVNVNYREASYIANGEVYSARADENKVLTIETGQTINTTIQTSSSIIAVNQPYAYIRSTGIPIPSGSYEISGADNLPISPEAWLRYGGKLTVGINPDIAGAIDISLTGPSKAIGSQSTFFIGVSDSGSQYASLSITGSSIKGSRKTLELLTGAPISLTTEGVATTVDNPFITTVQQAYDIGIMSANFASGPNLSLSGVISTGSITAFGLCQGSLIRYKDNIYRIDKTSMGNQSISFDATSLVTVADFYASWGSETKVSAHDYVWSGYQVYDEKITPLANIQNRQIYVFADVDSVPYFSESTSNSYSILIDTDGVPYFDTLSSISGSKLLYLDTDTTPYYV